MIFEVIPSVDLLGGNVVRLQRGSFEDVTVYSDDPIETAKRWEREGASRLHVVDLDGAQTGSPTNREIVEAIVRALAIPVQVGGGIRSVDAAVATPGDRVVLSTVTDDAVERLGPRLIAAIDSRDGEVRISGWQEGTGENTVVAAKRLAAMGVPRLLLTDIARDGLLQGPNVDLYREIVEAAQVPVLASGGVSSIDDLRVLASVDGVEGAIVGKALYEGKIDLKVAVS